MSRLFATPQTENLGAICLPEETGLSYTLRQRVVLDDGINGARATSFVQWQPALMGIYSAASEVFPRERVEAMLAVGHFSYGGSLSRNEVLTGLGGGSRLVAANVTGLTAHPVPVLFRIVAAGDGHSTFCSIMSPCQLLTVSFKPLFSTATACSTPTA